MRTSVLCSLKKGKKNARGLLPQLPVVCGDKRGTFLLGRQRVLCDCAECRQRPGTDRELTCTQFEVHAGAGAAKKWKSSMRIRPGGAPEVPPGANRSRTYSSVRKPLGCQSWRCSQANAREPPVLASSSGKLRVPRRCLHLLPT